MRKPVYTTAIGRWKKYGGAIKPLLDALGHKAEPKALGKKPAPKAPRKKTSKTSSET